MHPNHFSPPFTVYVEARLTGRDWHDTAGLASAYRDEDGNTLVWLPTQGGRVVMLSLSDTSVCQLHTMLGVVVEGVEL